MPGSTSIFFGGAVDAGGAVVELEVLDGVPELAELSFPPPLLQATATSAIAVASTTSRRAQERSGLDSNGTERRVGRCTAAAPRRGRGARRPDGRAGQRCTLRGTLIGTRAPDQASGTRARAAQAASPSA